MGSVEWKRVARGITWIGLGTLLLLNTTGQLRWSFWIEALTYWPVLLVALGLRLIFERSPWPWAVLTSTAVVLGTLFWVATAEPASFLGDWSDLRVDRPAEARAVTVETSLAFGSVDLAAADLEPGSMVSGRVASDRDARLRVSGPAETPRVVFERQDRGFHVTIPWKHERWDLAVPRDLKLDLELEAAFGRGTFDLAGAEVARFRLEGAGNVVDLKLGEPSRDVRIDLEGAFNLLDLEVPRSVPVTIRRDGFMNLRRGRRPAPDSGPGYEVRVDGAFNRVRVRSAD